MKKVLFATSALVLSAGFATAEVAVSGNGRMGMVYDGNDAQFSSRARVLFTLTGESDAGLSFGGAFRVDQENYSSEEFRSAARGTAGAVWVSGTYGKLTMGDTVSASEAAIGDLNEIGYTDGEFGGDIEEISYLTGDGVNIDQGANILYEYTVNNISFYASATDGSDNDRCGISGNVIAGTDDLCGDDVDTDSDLAYSLAAKYEAESFWAALGYAKHDEASEIVLGGEASFNNFSIKGVFAKYDDRTDGLDSFEHTIGLGLAYQMDAILIEGFYRKDKWEDLVTDDSENYDSFGIGAEYDLGGGAVLAGGIVDSDYLDDTVADLGVKFSF